MDSMALTGLRACKKALTAWQGVAIGLIFIGITLLLRLTLY